MGRDVDQRRQRLRIASPPEARRYPLLRRLLTQWPANQLLAS